MKLLIPIGFLFFALSFCGLTDKINQQIKDSGSESGSTSDSSSGGGGESPTLTADQQAIQDASKEVKWADQGISFKVPDGWPEMDVKKTSFNYGTPKTGFLLANISVMPDNFPSATSLTATYDSSLQQLKNGKYESARYLTIDGIKGVEWVEAMPEESDSVRRHQWIGFRNYQGQNQQLNIMLTTKGSEFKAKRDTFASIMYSMKIGK